MYFKLEIVSESWDSRNLIEWKKLRTVLFVESGGNNDLKLHIRRLLPCGPPLLKTYLT